jgi:hypothetical protein
LERQPDVAGMGPKSKEVKSVEWLASEIGKQKKKCSTAPFPDIRNKTGNDYSWSPDLDRYHPRLGKNCWRNRSLI